MPTDSKPIEEPWLEITTRTGLKIECPGAVADVLAAKAHNQLLHRVSRLTGSPYLVDLSDLLHVRQVTKTHNPARLLQAQTKAFGTSSQGSSPPSPTHESSSAPQEKPGASSPGVRTDVTIH
jgi:hypothetical protein